MKVPRSLRIHSKRAVRLVQTAGVSYTGMALSVVSAPLLARELGSDGRGVLAGAFVLVQLLSWSAFLGLPRGLALQELRGGRVSRSGLWVIGALGPLTAVIAFSVADVAANGDSRIASGIRVASCVLIFAGLSSLGMERALLRGRMLQVNLVRAVNLVLPSVAVIVAYSFDRLTLESAFLFTLGGQVLSVFLGIILSVPSLKVRDRTSTPWRFSLHYWGGSAFDGIGARVDQLLLAALVAPSQLGVYAVAVTCASAAGGFTQALNQLTYARLASAVGQDDGLAFLRLRSVLGFGMSVVTGSFVVVIVALFGSELFGQSYSGLLPVVAVLVVAQALNDQWQLRTYADSASGDPSALMWASASATALIVVLASIVAGLGQLDDWSMALILVSFGAVRLTVRGVLLRRRRQRASMEIT